MKSAIAIEKADAIMRAALAEDTGQLICLVYDLDEPEVDALTEAVQLIDKEACDYAQHVFEGPHGAETWWPS